MRAIAAGLAGLALLASILSIGDEMGTYLRSQKDVLSFYVDPDSQLAQPPRSLEGQYTALLTCDALLLSVERHLMPAERRVGVARDCQTLAEDILDTAPSLSAAHLIKALALNEQGAAAGTGTETGPETGPETGALPSILASEATGGDLVWMAERRFLATLPHFESLPEANRAALSRDIARLAQTNSGARILARQYQRNPALHEAIISTIDTLDAAVQQRFLSAVRRASS